MKVVLDASAVLAVFLNEPGIDKVRAVLKDAALSTVNLSEIYAKATEKGVDVVAARTFVSAMGVEIIPFGEAHAFLAGELRLKTRSHGLSLGDRACLATAMVERLPVMTADKAWLQLPLSVQIIPIR